MEEGIQFRTGILVGKDISYRYLRKMYDTVCLTIGAQTPRDLLISGRHLENVLFATDYLRQQNRISAGETIAPEHIVSVKNKIVVVIGGGDTGSDCVGTARRQGAKEIYQFEILPEPPKQRPVDTLWPDWPNVSRTSSSHREGCIRRWCIHIKRLSGIETRVDGLHGVEIEWVEGPNGCEMKEIPGTEFSMKVDIVLLAVGFLHVSHDGLVNQFGLELNESGNIKVDNSYMTNQPGVFAAGDAIMGASLIARAIHSGREAAAEIDVYLKNK